MRENKRPEIPGDWIPGRPQQHKMKSRFPRDGVTNSLRDRYLGNKNGNL